ncbi:hypothetical protein LPJ66_008908 [Kickxella alabastrina]|uniref:Uncharacterized protein n=1 Tax=Kickxella alabastrina TaxID=61397 RepID=A0ACC1I4S1_9FUNG|nr:hypothetical protein LPJ66_008908 [Kickxella alabastrina]
MTLPQGSLPKDSEPTAINGHSAFSSQYSSQSSNGNTNSTLHRYPGQSRQASRTCLRDSKYSEEQVVRLIMQELRDRGFVDTLSQLQSESGLTLEDEPVARFRANILAGEWSEVEATLSSIDISSQENMSAALFTIKRQQFLELLEDRKLKQALLVLQNELSTLTRDIPQLHRLSSLLMCPSPEELRASAAWDGRKGRSRFRVLEALQAYIPPGKMVPLFRMETLFDQAIRKQSEACERHVIPANHDLYTDHACPSSVFPQDLHIRLSGHSDEVWYVAFSPDGKYLASASRDKTCIVWSTADYSIVHQLEGHGREVSYLSWSPDSNYLISSCNDKKLRLWEVPTGRLVRTYSGHKEMTALCSWLSDNERFISAGLDQLMCIWHIDGTAIKQISSPRVHDLALSTKHNVLVAVDNLKTIHVYDLSSLTVLYTLEETDIIMSMALSADARFCLTELRSGMLHMWDLETRTSVRYFQGHNQSKYVMRCAFAGLDDSLVAMGEESGTLFVWNRNTGQLLERLKAHTKRINGCIWSTEAAALATASDDNTVCVWPAYRGAPSDWSDTTSLRLASASIRGGVEDDKEDDGNDDNRKFVGSDTS